MYHPDPNREETFLDYVTMAGVWLLLLLAVVLLLLAVDGMANIAHAAPPCHNGRCAPVVAQQIVGLNPYIYAVTPQYAAPSVVGADVDGILSAARQVERLRAGLGDIQAQGLQQTQAHQQRLQQALTAPPQPLAMPQPVKGVECPCPEKPAPVAPEPSPAANELDAKVLALFQAKCAKCHGVNGKGGLSLVDGGALSLLSHADRWAVYGTTVAEVMPPAPAPALTDDEVETLKAWARQK